MIENFKTSWADLKTRSGVLKYRDLSDYYFIWRVDEEITWSCLVMKDGAADQVEFESSYKSAANSNAKRYLSRSPDDLPLVTNIKNFSWNSINRVTHDFADKRTWYYSSVGLTDEPCANSLDHTTYALPSGLICPDLISDRDLLGSTYNWTVKKNGSTVTNFTTDYAAHSITFDSANLDTDEITVTGKIQNGSVYDLEPHAGKYFLVDYIEIQVSVDSTFNDTISFELILNNATTANTDVVVGKTTFKNAKDFLNKSNYGNSFPKFGELTKSVVILPWNFVTGYKLYPAGTIVDPHKNEFNKLRSRMINNSPITNCEIATATFYCYERLL